MDELLDATALDAIIPEIWADNFYSTLLAATPVPSLVARDYEGNIQQVGDKVNTTNFPEFAGAMNIAETQAAPAVKITPTQTQLEVNKITVLDYIITMKAERQSLNHVNQLSMLAMHAVEKKIQSDMVALFTPSASSPDHQIAFDSAGVFALADMLEAKQLLDNSNVPKDGRILLMGTDEENDLLNVTGFVSRDFVPAGSPLSSGSIQTPVLGFLTASTTEVQGNVYAFHPSFFQAAVQMEPSIEVASLAGEGKRARRVNTTTLWGCKQFSNVRVVSLS